MQIATSGIRDLGMLLAAALADLETEELVAPLGELPAPAGFVVILTTTGLAQCRLSNPARSVLKYRDNENRKKSAVPLQ
jgi:hypothetical protein